MSNTIIGVVDNEKNEGSTIKDSMANSNISNARIWAPPPPPRRQPPPPPRLQSASSQISQLSRLSSLPLSSLLVPPPPVGSKKLNSKQGRRNSKQWRRKRRRSFVSPIRSNTGSVFPKMMGDEEIVKKQALTGEIQSVIDTLSGVDTKTDKGTIIRPYDPSSLWLWRQWSGTIVQYVWGQVIGMMLFTALFGIIVSYIIGDASPYAEHPLLFQLELISGWWMLLSPLTTFVSTFFLAESFKFWKDFYGTARAIQGRFADISLVSGANASRTESDGKLTAGASAALDDIERMTTLIHLLFWCVIVKRFKCLLSPEGISYLLSKHQISRSEYSSLLEAGGKQNRFFLVGLSWLITRIELAVEREELKFKAGNAGMISIYASIKDLRALFATIEDMYDGRMPLAYVHFVQLLVSALVFISPVALFPLYWHWSILAVGILTLFYKGIFVLSMMFLDPVDNDDKHQKGNETVGFDVGVLLREGANNGACLKGSAAALPKY